MDAPHKVLCAPVLSIGAGQASTSKVRAPGLKRKEGSREEGSTRGQSAD